MSRFGPASALALLAVLAGGVGVAATARPGAARAGGGEVADSAQAPRTGSDQHVNVSASRVRPGAAELIVELKIDKGWHINANPASDKFLIPTSVQLDGDAELASVRYPPGKLFATSFGGELSVYEGTVAIPVATRGPGAAADRLVVRYQACTAKRCLRPSTSRLRLPP